MSTIFNINNFYGSMVIISDSGNEWRVLIEIFISKRSSAMTALTSYWKCLLMQNLKKSRKPFLHCTCFKRITNLIWQHSSKSQTKNSTGIITDHHKNLEGNHGKA